MACEYSVLALVEGVNSFLKFERSIMEWDIVMIIEFFSEWLGLLLVHVLLPDAEDIKPTTL